MSDDPIEQMLLGLIKSASTEYDETISALSAALANAGVPREEQEAVMMKVPIIAGPALTDSTESNMILMDVVFLGLLVHAFRDKVISREQEE
jgi:hypothetical protein